MSDGELLDAREAMSLLGINESELQTMVARGDLRAFRSAGTMKFRRDDVAGLKSEKKTEPTIVMPPNQSKAKPGSGILPTVSSARSPRGSSRNLPAVKPGGAGRPAANLPPKTGATDSSISSDQIILEEFELAPSESDAASNTQSVTAQQTAVGTTEGEETGNVTVVEQGVGDLDAAATASSIATVAPSPSGSGRTRVPSNRMAEQGLPAAPAISRVRAAVGSSSSQSAAKRAQASSTARTASPIMTLVLILTAFVSLLTTTVIGVQMFKGNYDPATGQRIIPPFLDNAPLINYRTSYQNLPGNPADDEGDHKRPADEFPGKK